MIPPPSTICGSARHCVYWDFPAGAGLARGWWPGIEEARLAPGYSGVRPKIVGKGQTADFRIDGPQVHGMAGLVNLFGIESPGLTSSLAIGRYVIKLFTDAR